MTVKNMAIAALVCGIVGIAGSFVPYVQYVAPICAIAGIIFGALSLKRIKAGEEVESKGLAIAGLVCGIIATAETVIAFMCVVCALCVTAGIIGGLGAMSSLFIL